MSQGTKEALELPMSHHRVHVVSDPMLAITGWFVRPFGLEHDAADPKGFYIGYPGEGYLLFIPDTAYVENRFQGVTILVIETNHASDMLSDNIQRKDLHQMIGRRIRRNHMSLQNVKDFIIVNMQKTLREIHLIHLSDLNSDEARFKREIQETTGVPVYVA